MKFLITLFLIISSVLGYSQDTNSTKIFKDTASTSSNSIPEPKYPGGQTGWMEYVMKNMHYPPKALKKQVQGAVILEIMIEADGSVSDVKVTDGPKLLWEEAIKLANNSGKWIAASVNGQPVKGIKKTFIFFAIEQRKKKEVGDMMDTKY